VCCAAWQRAAGPSLCTSRRRKAGYNNIIIPVCKVVFTNLAGPRPLFRCCWGPGYTKAVAAGWRLLQAATVSQPSPDSCQHSSCAG
jgi:hypothetical protein